MSLASRICRKLLELEQASHYTSVAVGDGTRAERCDTVAHATWQPARPQDDEGIHMAALVSPRPRRLGIALGHSFMLMASACASPAQEANPPTQPMATNALPSAAGWGSPPPVSSGGATGVATFASAGVGTVSALATSTSVPEPPPPPPAPARWTLSGSVQTKPAAAAKQAVVYLENGPLDRVVNGEMTGAKMALHPYVLVMTAGGTYTFINKEPFPDSAYSPNLEKFNFGILPVGGTRSRELKTPGAYTVLCSLHPNEVAFIVVSPSSYFAKTDDQGNFSMADVPAGTYDVVAWAPRLKPAKQSVTVDRDQTLSFELRR